MITIIITKIKHPIIGPMTDPRFDSLVGVKASVTGLSDESEI